MNKTLCHPSDLRRVACFIRRIKHAMVFCHNMLRLRQSMPPG